MPAPETGESGAAPGPGDVLTVAVWAGTVFGLLEGLVLNLTRADPRLLASLKTSADVVWVAPLVDGATFGLVGLGLILALRWAGGSVARRGWGVTYGVFLFLGFFGVLSAPRVIHLASAVLLGLGLAVVVARRIRGSAARLTAGLHRRLILAPAIVVLAWACVAGVEHAREWWRFRQLPETVAGER